MRIAILNDTHFGARSDSPIFNEYFFKFLETNFFPYLKQNNITTLIHLGDVVDRRKFVNFKIAHDLRNRFFNRLWKEKIDTHIILGNHDTYYKNTNLVNAIDELCTTYDGRHEPFIYTRPIIKDFGGTKILFLPWIAPDVEIETTKFLKTASADIVMGHLAVKGFEMHTGFINREGLKKEHFSRFEKVISGHFHKKSDDGQIYYLGSPYEITWNDYKCPKGFHIFDTATRELTRVSNPLRIFKKIIYDDTQEEYSSKDIKKYENCFIKIIVANKTNATIFDKFVDRLYKEITTHEINIIEDYSEIKESIKQDLLAEAGEDTMTFLNKYVEQLNISVDKEKLKKLLKVLYSEATDSV